MNRKEKKFIEKGNKPTEELRQELLNRAFKVRGLQILFALLCNPGLENQPLREMAKVADVALGTVQWVLKDLNTMGYASSRLLGRDVAATSEPKTKETILTVLEKQTGKQDRYKLVEDMIQLNTLLEDNFEYRLGLLEEFKKGFMERA